MAKEIFFFLSKKDLVGVLQELEKSLQLKYIIVKSYISNNIKEYKSLVDYEALGVNKSGNHQSESFLVLDKSSKLILKEVMQTDNTIRYIVSQERNMDSVVFWPSGIYENSYFICGHVGTISSSEMSQKIFTAFQKAIKKKCTTRIGRYYIGEEAKKSYNHMRFITINVNQPKEYDLKI